MDAVAVSSFWAKRNLFGSDDPKRYSPLPNPFPTNATKTVEACTYGPGWGLSCDTVTTHPNHKTFVIVGMTFGTHGRPKVNSVFTEYSTPSDPGEA